MKYLLSLFLITAFSIVNADQRFETAGGYSHFVVDPNNSDNEIYLSNCTSEIETLGGGARAKGYTICEVEGHEGVPWEQYTAPCENQYDCVLQGNQNTFGTTCNMVTSNYDADNDKWNQTEYVSNNWYSRYVATQQGYGKYKITYHLRCYAGQ